MNKNFSSQTKKIIAFLKLIRIHRPIPILLLIFPAFIIMLSQVFVNLKNDLNFEFSPIFLSLKILLGGFAVRSLGCTINDFFDQKIDSNSKRGKIRPFANGKLKPNDKIVIFGFSFLVFLAFGLMVSLKIGSILLCVLAVILTGIYPLTKRFFSVPQAFLGLTYGMPPLIIGFEVSGTFQISHLIFYIAIAFFIFSYDSIYAIQDKEDDLENNMHSSVIKFSASLENIISKLYNVAFILFLFFGFLKILSFGFYGGVIFGFFFIKFITKNFESKTNNEFQKIFELNTIPLLLIIIGLLIDISFLLFLS